MSELELEAHAARHGNAVLALEDLHAVFTPDELELIQEAGVPLSTWFGPDGRLLDTTASYVADLVNSLFDRILPPVVRVLDGAPLEEVVQGLNDGKGLREVLEEPLAALKAKRGSPEIADAAAAFRGFQSSVAPDGFDLETTVMGMLSSGSLDALSREASVRVFAAAASRIAPHGAADLLVDAAAVVMAVNNSRPNGDANRPEA